MPVLHLTYVTITGHWEDDDGNPRVGFVEFYSPTRLVDLSSDTIVIPRKLTATLDENGSINIQLAATDSDDFLPVDWTWQVKEFIAGADRRQYSILVPSTPTTQDLSDIAPVDPVENNAVYTILPDLSEILADIDDVESGLATEVTNRTNADTALQGNITAEAAARLAADNSEASTRASSDLALSNAITTETTNRGNADTTLQTNITNEANTRSSADSTLTTNLATEVTNRTNADTTLQTNINAKENSANKSNDTTMSADSATLFPTQHAAKSYVDSSVAAGRLTPTAIKTANYTAVPNDYIPVDTTTGVIVITLPSAPANGSVIAVKRVIGAANAVTVNCAGSDVFNVAAGVTAASVAVLNEQLQFRYRATGAIWYVETSMSLGGLDGRYSPLLHAANHASGGSDPITIAESQVTGLVTDLSNKQPIDPDLTTIAGLTATTDNVIQSVASAWASRTPAQLKTTLSLVKGDVGLGNVDNTSDINKPVSTAQQTALNLKADLANPNFTGNPTAPTQTAGDSSTKLATTAFVSGAVTSAVVGLLNYRGTFDCSTNLFPATGGSGTSGAILKGDFYICSVQGTLGGTVVRPGDLIIALVNTPAQTAANWDLIEHDVGYAPEDVANKSTDGTLAANSTTLYPSQSAVKTYADGKVIDSIADADTTHAPSRNAVFDALALKQDALGLTANTIYGRSSSGAAALKSVTDAGFSLLSAADAAAETALLNVATTALKGLMSAADKIKLNGLWKDVVAEFSADPTGGVDSRTAIVNAIASFGASGGVLYFPAGTYLVSANINIDKPIIFMGSGRSISVITATAATGNIFTCIAGSQGAGFEQIRMSASTAGLRTAGFAVDFGAISNVYMQQCDILFQWSGVRSGGALQFIDDMNIREGGQNAASGQAMLILSTGDRYVRRLTTDQTNVSTYAGIRINECSSVVMTDCNLIHSGTALDIQANAGATHAVASVYGVNCFFDTSTNGCVINCATASDTVQRVTFIRCWFSTHSANGCTVSHANVNSVDFIGCEFYQNVVGLDVTACTEWGMRSCRVAGNTTAGVRTTAGSTMSFVISDNSIGNLAGFGANAVGITIGAGAYSSYQIINNRKLDTNTTAGFVDNGTVSITGYKQISGNLGIVGAGPLLPLASGGSSYLANAGRGAATGTTVETFLATYRIPPNGVQIGDVIKISVLLQSSSTGTYTARVRCGTAGTIADALVNTAGVSAAGGINSFLWVHHYIYIVALGPTATVAAGIEGVSTAAAFATTTGAEAVGNVVTTAAWFITIAGTASVAGYTVRAIKARLVQ